MYLLNIIFENEQLDELVNRTAHAGVLSALVEAAASYRFYFAVYVLPGTFISPLALALPPFEIACGFLLLWAPTRMELGLNVVLAGGSLLIYLRSTMVSLRRPA
jgi:hypothetical protein